jgi:hypothetical protein
LPCAPEEALLLLLLAVLLVLAMRSHLPCSCCGRCCWATPPPPVPLAPLSARSGPGPAQHELQNHPALLAWGWGHSRMQGEFSLR